MDNIEAEWSVDCKIDVLDLTEASRVSPYLHAKYYPIYSKARRKLFKMKIAYKKLKAEKHEFLNNPDQERINAGWKYPDRMVLKNEIPNFIDSDAALLTLELNIGEQDLLVDFLQDILKQIANRNWIIRNILEDRKFMSGG